MKRPLMYAGLALMSGTICGIQEMPVVVKYAACLLMAAAILRVCVFSQESASPFRIRRMEAALIVCMFILGSVRGAFVSSMFHTPEAELFFQRYEATNPGQFDYAMYLKGQGICSEESYLAFRGKEPEGNGFAAMIIRPLKKVSGSFANTLELGFDAKDAGIYKALLLGEKDAPDPEIRDLYRASGIAHLLAVSGLHVSILGMGAFGILRRRKFGRIGSGLAAGILVFAYLLMIGVPGSGLRAFVMLLFAFAAGAAGRAYDMRSALFAALILMILQNPYQLFQSGFQLSFAAVFGIAFVGEETVQRIERLAESRSARTSGGRRIRRLNRLPGWVRILIVSMSIQLVTLPVTIWHYFSFPLYGLFLNLIVVPLMGAVLISGMGVLAVITACSFPAAVLYGSFRPKPGLLSAAAAAPGHYILLFYEKLSSLSVELPFSSILFGRPELWQILVYYAVLWGALYLTMKVPDRASAAAGSEGVCVRGYGSIRGSLPSIRIPVLFVILIVNTVTLRHITPAGVTVTALDVGQGDGFLIETKEHTVLIDCGSSGNTQLGNRILAPLLYSKGISAIDCALVSHADTDHINGLTYLMEEEDDVCVKRLILPGPARGHEKYEALVNAFRRQMLSEEAESYLTDGREILSDGAMRISCIYAGTPSETEEINCHSPAVLLESGAFRMLFTGDMSAAEEADVCRRWEGAYPGKHITVLKTAHHGSDTSTSVRLMETMHPKYAVISAGRSNRYGHPSKEVTDRLSFYGTGVLGTYQDGAVLIHVRDGRMRIRSFPGTAAQTIGRIHRQMPVVKTPELTYNKSE